MASPSDIKNFASEETEVTSEDRRRHHHQQLPAERQLDLELPLVRQSSIYSLTLDEIQNSVCEPGKTFGSMNMDEFLTNIWNAEEVQAADAGEGGAPPMTGNLISGPAAATSGVELRRQGSLTLPAPLCRKTVDEVWGEIQPAGAALRCRNPASRQPTLGEMTLEDFLIKAGVVREGYAGIDPPAAPPAPVTPPQQYGMAEFQISTTEMPPEFAQMANGVGYPVIQGYMANGYDIDGSPTSPERGMSSRKRWPDNGTVADKVVERRQRRMIKNRESAARSRARKQAYTLELEAELNQLKEENTRIKEEQKKAMQLRKKLLLDTMSEQARTNVHKTVSMLRRCNSTRW